MPMTKLEAELILFGYMKINGRIPDKVTADVLLSKEKERKSVLRYLQELKECMPFDSLDVCELSELHPERARLYRMVRLLGEAMDAADTGMLSADPDYNGLSPILAPPQISVKQVERYYFDALMIFLPLREVQRDVQLCKKILLLIQEQNGKEKDWGIDGY